LHAAETRLTGWLAGKGSETVLCSINLLESNDYKLLTGRERRRLGNTARGS